MRTTRDYNFTRRPRTRAMAAYRPARDTYRQDRVIGWIALTVLVLAVMVGVPTLIHYLAEAVTPWLPR